MEGSIRLPVEVVLQILKETPGADVLRVCQTDVTLSNLCDEEGLWFSKLSKEFGIPRKLPQELAHYKDNPKSLYIALLKGDLKLVGATIDGKRKTSLPVYKYDPVGVVVAALLEKYSEVLPENINEQSYHISFITPARQYLLITNTNGTSGFVGLPHVEEQHLADQSDVPMDLFREGAVWKDLERIDLLLDYGVKTRFLYTSTYGVTSDLSLSLALAFYEFQNLMRAVDDKAEFVDLTFSFQDVPLRISLDRTTRSYSERKLGRTFYAFLWEQSKKRGEKIPWAFRNYTLTGVGIP